MKIKKVFSVILLSIFVLVAVYGEEASAAATGNITISNKNGDVGSTVTITATLNATEAIYATTVVLNYRATELQYISGSTDVTGGGGAVTFFADVSGQGKRSVSFNVTFKILTEGAHVITGSSSSTYTEAAVELVSVTSGTGTITGKYPTTTTNPSTNNNQPSGNNNSTTNSNKPGNNNTPAANNPADSKDGNSKLNNLQVNPGTLAPAFAADTTSYTVTVPKDTTEITIAATAQSDKARVTVTGGKDLKPGENEAKVVVMAESGATTVYTLTILCGEEAKIQVDGRENTINETFTDEQIPTGFVRDKITYDDRQYEALKHEKGELYLVNLQNGETGASFYIYDQKTQEFYHYVQIGFQDNRYIIVLPLDQTKEFAKCEMTTLTLQDKQFDAWKLDDEYSVIRVMNHDGEITFYQYDSLDGTLQRYAKTVAQEIEEEKEFTFLSFLEKYHLYVIAGLGAFVLILAIILIYLFATKNHRHRTRRQRLQKRLEKQREE